MTMDMSSKPLPTKVLLPGSAVTHTVRNNVLRSLLFLICYIISFSTIYLGMLNNFHDVVHWESKLFYDLFNPVIFRGKMHDFT